ncbi:HTH domain-containing protein [Staphylococcus capitis]|uniref:HTH domain-containing protein n=1 Tax=Staphylococcus capitis TaxID=29388 RepID=UPI002DB94C6F|nr:HTH domain-containing protein [Staphylococcus capitis]MEB5628423.1 HTH domain-containing protein [Staphylococcus capitis]
MTNARDKLGLGILTKEIRTRKDLTFFEKILIFEFHYLTDNAEGSTYITSEELAEMYGVSVSTVKRAISKLEKLGFISKETKNIDYVNVRKIKMRKALK